MMNQTFYPDPEHLPEENQQKITATEFLSRGIRINDQMESLRMQLAALQSQAERMTSWAQEVSVKHSPNLSAMQDAVCRIMEAKEKLEADIIQMECVKTEITLVISRVKDPICRKLLLDHYLEGMRWKEISTEKGNSESHIMKTRKKALREVQRILDKQ